MQMSDTPQVESSAVMLRHAGYEVKVCGSQLRDELKRIGGDCVVSVQSAVSSGCDPLDPTIGEASLSDVDRCDLFCDIKINNLHAVLNRWPKLEGRLVFWRVNGARPEHVRRPDGRGGVIDCGDETNPPCPAITANLWYGKPEYNREGRNYVFWPPYPRQSDYDPSRRDKLRGYANPFCLCHNVRGWGYREIVDVCVRRVGLDIYGHGSPAGPIPHSAVPDLVAHGLCTVHLKGSDCPGWALYESLLGGCPVVVARWLVARSAMGELFDDETCCLFSPIPDETGRGDPRFDDCVEEIVGHCKRLRLPKYNRQVGMAGRERLLSLMWNVERDGPGFVEYMRRTFP